MSFRDNLMKKIKIDRLVKDILRTIAPVGSGIRIDKDAVRRLLEMAPYTFQREREMDFYIKTENPDKNMILVLDNDLPIYQTTVADVALRRNPAVKEMISIRNIMKILNDSDVVKSKKEDSLKTVQKDCMDLLDLSYNEADIEEIKNDGTSAFNNNDSDGVVKSIILFSELLGFRELPKGFHIEDHHIAGGVTKRGEGDIVFGPIVIYHLALNTIKFMEEYVSQKDPMQKDAVFNVAMGKEKSAYEGNQVFEILSKNVIKLGRSSLLIQPG